MMLYGASGHGKVVNAILRETAKYFIDDDKTKVYFEKKKVITYEEAKRINLPIIITIGNNGVRKEIASSSVHEFGAVISNTSIVDSSVDIREGCQIIHGALIQTNTFIGKHCIVNSMASIDHDCKLGDFVHIGPNATLCGNVSIDIGSFIGAGSVLIPNIRVGKWCIVGAGSVVTKDVPDYSIVVGNPGRIIKNNVRN